MENSTGLMSSISAMGHTRAESSARFQMGDPALRRGSATRTPSGGVATTARYVHEEPPPAPGLPSPAVAPVTAASHTEPPVWSVSAALDAITPVPGGTPERGAPADLSPVSQTLVDRGDDFRGRPARVLRAPVRHCLPVLVRRRGIRTPGQAGPRWWHRPSVLRSSTAGSVAQGPIRERCRWRLRPPAGTLAPVLLSRDLLSLLGIPDVWVGQAFTLHVLFPMCVGIPATIAALVSPVRGGNQ